MASMYAKLMSRITESSLMEEPVTVRYTFMMMLAIADPQGYVVGTDVAIARRMNISLEEFQRNIGELMKPDAHSNSQEEEGRRVVSSDSERGYFVVNYRKYRDTRDEEQRREYMRKYMQDRRAKEAPVNPSVSKRKQRKPQLAKEEVEVKEEENTSGEGAKPSAGSENSEHQKLIAHWHAYFEKRTGSKYHFQGGRDGKAVKTLITFFKTVSAVRDFVKKCHERVGEGYPFNTLCDTLHDLANNISRLQAALSKPPKTAASSKPYAKQEEHIKMV